MRLNMNMKKIAVQLQVVRKLVTTKSDPKTISQHAVSGLTPSIITSKLRSNGLPFTEGFTCFHILECRFCGPALKRSQGGEPEIFVNKTTGYFVCEKCKSTGNWDIFSRLLSGHGKERSQKEVAALKDGCIRYDKSVHNWKQILEDCDLLHKLKMEECDTILKNFNLPALNEDFLRKIGCYVNKDRSLLYFPLHTGYHRQVYGYKTLDKSGNSNTIPRNDSPGFLISSNKRKVEDVVIVATIPDFLTLASQDLSIQVICLPYGVSNLPQNGLPFLESFKKIILWLGAQVGAWDSAFSFAKKLNNERCFIVRPTEEQISAAAVYNSGKGNLEKIVNDAHPICHQAIITFQSLRDDILSELQHKEEVLGVKWQRFPTLNKILKGHRRGELTVLTGPTGCGKTTFMSEYSLDLAMQGVNTLWGSFEIRNVRLATTMLTQFANQSLDANLDQFNKWANEFENLPLYFMTFQGQQSVKEVMDAVEYSYYVYDIAHVIIDNVQFMVGVSDIEGKQFDRFWKQDVIIQSFRTFATKNNCHVTLVIHPRKERDDEDLTTRSIFGGAKAAQEADNILIVQDKRLTSIRGKKFLQVLKNRHTGDLGMMVMDFNKEALSFSEKKALTKGTNKIEEPGSETGWESKEDSNLVLIYDNYAADVHDDEERNLVIQNDDYDSSKKPVIEKLYL